MGAFFVNFSDDGFKAGGLRDNFRGKITDYKFTTDGPANYGAQALFLQLELEFVENGETVTDDQQFYSLGGKALDSLMPSDDGYGLVLNPNNPNGVSIDGVRLIEKTKFDLFRRALIKAGFPQSCLVGGPNNPTPFKSIIGLECHWVQEAVQDRNIKDGQERKRPETVLVPNKIHVLSPVAQQAMGAGGGLAGAPAGGGVRGRRPAGAGAAQVASAATPAAVAAPAASPARAPRPRAGGAAPAPAPTPAPQVAPAAPTTAPGTAVPYAQATPEVQAAVTAYYTKIADLGDAQTPQSFAQMLISSVPSPAIRGTIKTMHPSGGALFTDSDGSQLAALGFALYDAEDGAGGVVVGYLES